MKLGEQFKAARQRPRIVCDGHWQYPDGYEARAKSSVTVTLTIEQIEEIEGCMSSTEQEFGPYNEDEADRARTIRETLDAAVNSIWPPGNPIWIDKDESTPYHLKPMFPIDPLGNDHP